MMFTKSLTVDLADSKVVTFTNAGDSVRVTIAAGKPLTAELTTGFAHHKFAIVIAGKVCPTLDPESKRFWDLYLAIKWCLRTVMHSVAVKKAPAKRKSAKRSSK